MNKRIEIRQVWQDNLELEFRLIERAIRLYPFVSIDTEFPGTVFVSTISLPSQAREDRYNFMKANVDSTNIIQLGLTLSDCHGNLPDFGTHSRYIWEFNFSDFDVDCDLQNKDSIKLLKHQGIDFDVNKQKGIRSVDFSRRMRSSWLVAYNGLDLTWVTFHSAYDFGFLIKILSQRELPRHIDDFMVEVQRYFGQSVYDMKHMIKYCQGLYGGLEKVANSLRVDRVAGKSHQAGSDSLLTLQTFMKLNDVYFGSRFRGDDCNLSLHVFRGVLHGLEVEAH